MTAEKPILFSGPMVRAILEGRKTQTRRVLKLPTKHIYVHPKMGGWAASTIGGNDGSFHIIKGEKVPTKETACIWHQTTGDCIATPTIRWENSQAIELIECRSDAGRNFAPTKPIQSAAVLTCSDGAGSCAFVTMGVDTTTHRFVDCAS